MTTFTFNEIKTFWGISSDEVVGQFTPFNEVHGFFNNLMGFDEQGQGRILLHPLNGQRLSVIAYTDKLTFEPGQYYKLTIRLKSPTITLHEKTDKVLLAIDSTKPVRSIYNPYRTIISSCFDRFDNPDANKVLASLLHEVGRGLYSSKKRMFFELLQNADDLPTGMPERPNDVNIYVEGCKGYLLIMNNGQPFNEDDVRSVTSAAESTKLRQNKKTGYKGIGFKSVFTDSTKVVIKSGGFTFEFDKQAPVFRNFEELYIKNHPLYRTNSDARAYFLERHGKNKAQYERIESVPWHLKPIWNSLAIDELVNTAFYKNYTYNVGIALNFGQTKVAEYLNEFGDLFADPRFLLFLRNTTRIQLANSFTQLEAERTVISGSETEGRQETQVRLLRNVTLHSTYLIQRVSIAISNTIFQSVGIDVLLQSKEVAGELVSIFCNGKGDELPIPSKLATFSEIQLHLAAPLVNGNVTAETIKSFAGTSIYTYLPMKESRIQLPILVNADFVPSSDREKVQADNSWNHFLFFNIGYQLVSWVASLATSSRGDDYLNLLPPKPLNSGDTDIEPIEAWFNKGYEHGLNEIAFVAIPDANGAKELVKTHQTIVNDSELLSLFDESFFYAFTGTNPATRRVPQSGLDTTVLKSNYFQEKHHVQVFTNDDLITRLSEPEAVAVLIQYITHAESALYQKFIERLNRLVEKYSERAAPLIDTLPFIRFGNKILAWSAITEQDEYLLIDDRTDPLRQELMALGLALSDLNIDKTPALKSALHTKNTYINTDTILYEKVSVRCAQHPLEPAQKASLFTFFKGLGGVGDTKYAQSLCLFADNSGIGRPLDKLLSCNIDGLPAWLERYKITEAEFKILPSEAGKHLVQRTNLFSKILCDPAVLADFTKNLDSRHVSEWVTQLLQWRNREEPKTNDSGWSALPWIYTDDMHRFRAASELWDHDALVNVPAQAVLESLTDWLFPHPDSRPVIEQFALRLKSASLTTGITHTDKILSEADTQLLIQYLKEALEATFLKKWTFLVAETGFKLSALANKTVYVADEPIQSFIEASGLRESFVTVPAGLADTDALAAIGAITGDKLLTLLTEKQAGLSLAPLLLKRADTKLYATFLQNLPALAISSTLGTYTDQSPEVHVLRIAHDIAAGGNSTLFSSFLNKTTLDGHPISEITDFLPTVTVRNLVGKEPYKFSTAELLPNNAGRIERIQRALNMFSDCKLISQKFLRDQVFCSIELKADNAESEIHKSTPDFLSPVQLVFLQTLRQSKGETNPHFKTKDFYTYWVEEEGNEKALSEVEEYLTLLYDNALKTSYSTYGLDSYVVDPEYCFEESESLPDFFAKWADTNDKLLFLTQLNEGANGSDSNVVKLRKALLEGDNIAAKSLVRTVEKRLLINTLKWLCDKQDDNLTTTCIETIDEILKNVAWPSDQSPVVPIIISIENDTKTYRLAEFANQIVHTWSESWKPYEKDVLGMLAKQGAWVVENTFPGALDELIGKLDTNEPIKKLAADIQVGALLLSEPCYEAWDGKADSLIYRIAGHKIPWQVWYGETLIADIEEGDRLYDEETAITYLTAESVKNFPRNLPVNFPETHKNVLYELAWKLREHPEEDTRSQTKFYTPEFERIIGGDELNDEQQGNEFKSAILRGVPYLEEQGFDFRECTVSTGLHFLNVRRDGFKDPYHITFRSAKRGLLYLNLGAWKRLGVYNEVIIVVYQGGEMRLFSSKEELLAEKWNEYMLYRVEKPVKIDEDYEGIILHDKTTHLLFVTSEKMYQSLYQDRLAQKSNKPIIAPTVTPDEL